MYREPARSDERARSSLWIPESAENKARDTFFQEFAGATLINKADFAMLFQFIPKHYPVGLRHLLLGLYNTNMMNLILRGLNPLEYLIKRAKR
jgi:glutathione S-transferase